VVITCLLVQISRNCFQ